MEMDHFRPWRKKFGALKELKFEYLVNEPTNLVHSCGVCNGFKLAYWPTENPDLEYDHEKGWIDPFKECRADFFKIQDDGSIIDLKAPAKYQIKKLRLNRPLLNRLREYRLILEILENTQKPKWQGIVEERPGTEHAKTAALALHLLGMFQVFINSGSSKISNE